MTTKIKIDISNGILEVEGSEEFVQRIYDEFKEQTKDNTPKPAAIPKKKKAKRKKTSSGKLSKSGKSNKITDPVLDKDLDLSGGDNIPSLREFFNQYVSKKNFERNLIFLYYLKQILEIDKVNINQIFTCYRHFHKDKIKTPKALHQSLRDTADDKGWVDANDFDDIKLPIAGVNYLEQDLEKTSE